MANPHGLPLSDVIKEEKRLGIVPKTGQSIQKRRRTLTLKKSRLKGGKARDAKFRKTHRLRIRARDRERVRTPEQLRHQAEYQRQRRLDIKAARLLPPSKRTKKQKKLERRLRKKGLSCHYAEYLRSAIEDGDEVKQKQMAQRRVHVTKEMTADAIKLI